MKIDDMLAMCKTNRRIAEICRDNHMWWQIYRRDISSTDSHGKTYNKSFKYKENYFKMLIIPTTSWGGKEKVPQPSIGDIAIITIGKKSYKYYIVNTEKTGRKATVTTSLNLAEEPPLVKVGVVYEPGVLGLYLTTRGNWGIFKGREILPKGKEKIVFAKSHEK